MNNRRASVSAVDAVMGRLFERGHRKERGGALPGRARAGGGAARRPSLARMRRAGARHGKAIFKLVRSGGTHDRAGLKGQLDYVFRDDKLARVIDPTARVDRMGRPGEADLNRITRQWSTDWWKNTRNGNTSHMILSFPRGVSIDAVETITRAVCHEMFEAGERRLKYIAAIHDDTAHHPHAHIILNRRADDNTLFTMRSGTEFSYEGFRESMAAHGSRLGIQLDPTFRFERGITAAQPAREAQLEAQRAGTAPRQEPRAGDDLIYHRELVDYARIGFEAMAAIAFNADLPRLEEAYASIATLMQSEQEFAMPDLSTEDLDRFDAFVGVLGEAIRRTEQVIATKAPAERVDAERKLDDILRSFTELSADAPYARDLHRPAGSGTIYAHALREIGHETGRETGAPLASPEAQAVLRQAGETYGLDAAALAARLESGPPSLRLEQDWLKTDAEAVIAHGGLDFSDLSDRAVVMDRLAEAYEALRTGLLEAGVLRPAPHLDPDHRWRPPQPERYAYQPAEDERTARGSVPSRLTTDVQAVLEHYRQGGAPADWIRENKARIREDMADLYVAERQDWLAAHREVLAPFAKAITRDETGRIVIADRQAAHDFVGYFSSNHLERIVPREQREAIGSHLATRYPDIPHHVADYLADQFERATRAVDAHIRAETRPFTDRDFEAFARRNSRDGLLDLDRNSAEELRGLLRAKLTGDELDRLERGDAKALRPHAADRGFTLGVMALLEGDARVARRQFSPQDEDRLDANRRELQDLRDRVRDRREAGRDREDDHGWER